MLCLWEDTFLKTWICMAMIFEPYLGCYSSIFSQNFHSIFALMRNGYNNLFSLITQPWCHLGAILWFHFIIHIFITIHHKLPKFRVHMECDQTIKSHKNIKLIWGHLGYANEGQRSNLILFCIWKTVGPIEPKFWYVVAETILYKNYDIYFSFWWRHHSQIID